MIPRGDGQRMHSALGDCPDFRAAKMGLSPSALPAARLLNPRVSASRGAPEKVKRGKVAEQPPGAQSIFGKHSGKNARKASQRQQR